MSRCLTDVVIVAHSYHDSEELKKENLDVTLVLIDVKNTEAAKETIEKNEGRLDGLVNNVGRF